MNNRFSRGGDAGDIYLSLSTIRALGALYFFANPGRSRELMNLSGQTTQSHLDANRVT